MRNHVKAIGMLLQTLLQTLLQNLGLLAIRLELQDNRSVHVRSTSYIQSFVNMVQQKERNALPPHA
jgi:hypothetical protein